MQSKLETLAPSELSIETEHKFAYESLDFKKPRGAKSDTTRSQEFVEQIETFFGRKITCLNLGCSSGGVVFDFLRNENWACGVEGSDYPFSYKTGFWGIVPECLFTADLTKPFRIRSGKDQLKFDLVCAWEVLEHIQEDDLVSFFENVRAHLSPDGYFMASVAQFPDIDPESGQNWHVTIESKEWWSRKFAENGFAEVSYPQVTKFPSGCGNPSTYDWDSQRNPSYGFHVVFKVPI